MKTILLAGLATFIFLIGGAIMFSEPESKAQTSQVSLEQRMEQKLDATIRQVDKQADHVIDSLSKVKETPKIIYRRKTKIKEVMPTSVVVAVPVEGGYKEVQADVYKGVVILPDPVPCEDTCAEMPLMIEAMVDTIQDEINWRQRALNFITKPFKKTK